MAEDLKVTITGSDGVSRTFQTVERSAGRMGQTVEQAGTRSSRALDAANTRAVAFGAAIGATALVLAEFGRAAAEEEAIFAGLTAAVEATGESFDTYATAIDGAIAKGEALAFADDQVATALNRMIVASGDVQGSIDNLGVAMDFARARGIDLATAADLIGRAMAGQTQTLSRYGIVVEEGASKTEVLAAVQAKVAGQADAYANTTQGSLDRVRNSFDNLTETIGAHAGPMQVLISLLPGLKVGYAAAVPVVAALGAALGPIGLVATAIGAGVAIAELTGIIDLFGDKEREVVGETDDLTAALNRLAASGFNTAKLDAYDRLLTDLQRHESSLQAQLEKDRDFLQMMEDLPGPAFRRFGGEEAIAAVEREIALIEAQIGKHDELQQELNETDAAFATLAASVNDPGYDQAVANIDALTAAYERGDISREQWLQGIQDTVAFLPEYNRRANEATESTVAVARAQIDGTRAGETWADTLVRGFLDVGKAAGIARNGTVALAQEVIDDSKAGPTWVERLVDDLTDVGALTAPTLPAPELETIDATAVIQADAAYRNLADGILTANEAQAIFKDTQDGLIESQSVYSHQQSEYESQLGSLQEAEDILNQRRAEGVALTAEQEDFLNRVDAAQERVQGGAEDAAVAEGMLALQYAENVRIGDQLNDTMGTQQAITGALIDLVADLIAELHGIPDEVKTDIELVGADAAIGQAASLAGTLANIPTSKRIDIVTAFTQTGTPPGLAGLGGVIPYAHGGIIPIDHAQHGILGSGRLALVGEAGPELVRLPPLSHISPSPATASTLHGAGQRPIVININAPVYGVDGLMELIARELGPALADALADEDRALGMTA